MQDIKTYQYNSCLAPFMQGLVAEKRALGFIYNTDAYELHRFDMYWCRNGNGTVDFTYEQISGWLARRKVECRDLHGRRIRVVRMLARHMNSLGRKCHVPVDNAGRDTPVVHILSNQELQSFFHRLDMYSPRPYKRLAMEYPVMFRIIYCCGLRNGEACALKTGDVDIERGIIKIWHGKGNKSRLIYLPDDLKALCACYYKELSRRLGFEPYWFFPASLPDRRMSRSYLNKVFTRVWSSLPCANACEKKPTVHCLRHTFVVNRINSWVLGGIDLNVMLPYLSKHLGHKGMDETLYYYHQVDDAFRIVREKDTIANDVIPEVKRR